jgi:hypothetical protein
MEEVACNCKVGLGIWKRDESTWKVAMPTL